jgi:hypothetical protein
MKAIDHFNKEQLIKSLKYLTLSILSLSIASVGYAAMMGSEADYTKANQQEEVLKNKPLEKKVIILKESSRKKFAIRG